MKALLLAAAGGAIGAGARYLVSAAAIRIAGPTAAFPWGTFTVNVLGCFLMGVLIEAIAVRYSVSSEMRTFLATGVLGGFTTFSAFALDVSVLLARKDTLLVALYVAGSVGLSIFALFLGIATAKSLLT